jgi:branched-subunit amino acid aminotransferase/4-amino-4-deoxychorismate lyase
MIDPSFAVLDGALTRLNAVGLGDMPTAFFFGAGVFETLLAPDGGPELLGRHLARLRGSLAALPAIVGPPPGMLADESVRHAIVQGQVRCIEATGLRPAIAKLVVADGHVLITFRHVRARAEATVDELEVACRAGDPLGNHKTLAYLRSFASLARRTLFLNERSEVCEAPSANVFVAFHDRVATPPLEAPCLPGIIRGVLLEHGRLGGLPIVEEPITAARLADADGCVLTNSVVHALPVATCLGRALPRSDSLAQDACRAIAAVLAADSERRANGRGAASLPRLIQEGF